jgi:hypothetical protein
MFRTSFALQMQGMILIILIFVVKISKCTRDVKLTAMVTVQERNLEGQKDRV